MKTSEFFTFLKKIIKGHFTILYDNEKEDENIEHVVRSKFTKDQMGRRSRGYSTYKGK